MDALNGVDGRSKIPRVLDIDHEFLPAMRPDLTNRPNGLPTSEEKTSKPSSIVSSMTLSDQRDRGLLRPRNCESEPVPSKIGSARIDPNGAGFEKSGRENAGPALEEACAPALAGLVPTKMDPPNPSDPLLCVANVCIDPVNRPGVFAFGSGIWGAAPLFAGTKPADIAQHGVSARKRAVRAEYTMNLQDNFQTSAA
jgi:hypothetical protein